MLARAPKVRTSGLFRCRWARHLSSEEWLARQYNDPYVKARLSSPDAYRSRSAFKLLEIMQSHKNALRGSRINSVIDLGAAPGGWSQVMAGYLGIIEEPEPKPAFGLKSKGNTWSGEQVGNSGASSGAKGKGKAVIAVDVLPMAPLPGVHTLKLDFLSRTAREAIVSLLIKETGEEKADVILSDMAQNATGNRIHDIEASMEISHAVFQFAREHLRPSVVGERRGGALLLKHFQSEESIKFQKQYLYPNFRFVYTIKPPASRSESSEFYWLCWAFVGNEMPKPPMLLP